MKLKEHRQLLMATLDAIRQAVPDDCREEIEQHLRKIVGYDKELREQLRNLPEQLEAARAEISSVRSEGRREAEIARQETAEVNQQLASERARRNRERGKSLSARIQEWRDLIVEATHASEENAQSIATWLLAVTANHFTNVAMHSQDANHDMRLGESALLHELCETVNTHMKGLGAHFYVHWHKGHFIVQTGMGGDRLHADLQSWSPS